jgi:hypothetical protein
MGYLRRMLWMFQHWQLFLLKNRFAEITAWAASLSWCKVHLFEQDLVLLDKCSAADIPNLNAESLIDGKFRRNKFVRETHSLTHSLMELSPS